MVRLVRCAAVTAKLGRTRDTRVFSVPCLYETFLVEGFRGRLLFSSPLSSPKGGRPPALAGHPPGGVDAGATDSGWLRPGGGGGGLKGSQPISKLGRAGAALGLRRTRPSFPCMSYLVDDADRADRHQLRRGLRAGCGPGGGATAPRRPVDAAGSGGLVEVVAAGAAGANLGVAVAGAASVCESAGPFFFGPACAPNGPDRAAPPLGFQTSGRAWPMKRVKI